LSDAGGAAVLLLVQDAELAPARALVAVAEGAQGWAGGGRAEGEAYTDALVNDRREVDGPERGVPASAETMQIKACLMTVLINGCDVVNTYASSAAGTQSGVCGLLVCMVLEQAQPVQEDVVIYWHADSGQEQEHGVQEGLAQEISSLEGTENPWSWLRV
jgi:hypothetical protein